MSAMLRNDYLLYLQVLPEFMTTIYFYHIPEQQSWHHVLHLLLLILKSDPNEMHDLFIGYKKQNFMINCMINSISILIYFNSIYSCFSLRKPSIL